MKMDLVKKHGCLAMSILPLLLLVNPTAACYCDGMFIPYAVHFCKAEIVLEGYFLRVFFPNEEDMTWARYEFGVTDILKGRRYEYRNAYLDTQVLGTTCKYAHHAPFADEKYIVAGYYDDDRKNIIISKCSLIQPSRTLDVEQLRNTRCELLTRVG